MRLLLFALLYFYSPLSGAVFTLEEAENYAMARNKHVLALEELANASREQYFEIISRWLPHARFQGEYDKSEFKVALLPGLKPQSNFWTTGFHFDQLLVSKELYHQIKAGKWDAHRVKLEAVNLKNEVLFEVRAAYWFAVLAKEEVAVQTENIRLLKEALDEEDRRQKAGKATAFNVNQSKVALTNAHTDYYTSVRDYKAARNHLLRVLGMGPECGEEAEVADQDIPVAEFWMLADKLNLLGWEKAQDTIDLPNTEAPLFTCEEKRYWQELALDNNPNILIQDSDVGFQRQTRKSHTAEYYPTLRSFASYGQQFVGVPTFDKQFYSWYGGIQLNWNIFDGLGREHRIAEASFRESSALWNYWRACDDALIDIKNQLDELEQALYSYYSAHASKLLSKTALEQAMDRLKAGMITPLEYRDAAYSYTQARHNSNRAAYELLRGYYALRRIAGIDVAE